MKGHHQLFLHPEVIEDIQRDSDEQRKELRKKLATKYPLLPDAPGISFHVVQALGEVEPGSNDWVDHCLISALQADAVDFLVTEDQRVRKKAARLGLESRVTTVAEACAIIRDLFDEAPPAPPAVESTKAHGLDGSDPIFESLRDEYPGFDEWLRKCKREHRQAWTVPSATGKLAAVCIVNQEHDEPFGLEGKVLKLCTFKVSEDFSGHRFGELLLKAVFGHANQNAYDWIFVTVYPRHELLIALLMDFGFENTGKSKRAGELVLAKPMSHTEKDRRRVDPLQFHIRYGPFAVELGRTPAFLIPIEPVFHQVLFPEAESQLELLPGRRPFGNSIRKAYLCNSGNRRIEPGSAVLFYRSRDVRGVTTVGVVEGTLVSKSATKIAQHVGKRTVYSFKEIEKLCGSGEVLAILFRQAKLLDKPVPLDELTEYGVLKAPPQSITSVPPETLGWLRTRLTL